VTGENTHKLKWDNPVAVDERSRVVIPKPVAEELGLKEAGLRAMGAGRDLRGGIRSRAG